MTKSQCELGAFSSLTVTFLLVQRWQDAVVSTDLEVDLLLHAVGDGPLRDDDADTRLDGAQDASVGVKDPSSCCDHRVTLILLVVLQSTGAERRAHLL